MAAPSNRRERRRQAKTEKEVIVFQLLEYAGTAVTAGAYYDIMNTPWRGARKCEYSYGDTYDWHSLVSRTKFYFAPLGDRFQVTMSTDMSEKTRFLFVRQGDNLMLNISFQMEHPRTLNIFLPGCVLDVSRRCELIQKKTSTVYTDSYDSWFRAVKNYTQEQRETLRETYLQQGADEQWAAIMCGFAPKEFLEENICTLLIGDILTQLLEIFRTLAFMDYAQQRGHQLLWGDNHCLLSTKAIADIEAECTNHVSVVSNCKINYRDIEEDNVHVIGNPYHCYNAHGPSIPSRFVNSLAQRMAEHELDLDAITAKSKEHFFYLDKLGNPMVGSGKEALALAYWMLTETGLHDATSGQPFFGVYKRIREKERWEFACFLTPMGFYLSLEESGMKGLSLERWQPLMGADFVLNQAGLRGIVDKAPSYRETTEWTCAPQMLEDIADNYNIKTLEQMNFFIDGFIRMLRRRKVDAPIHALYCTGLTDKTGRYMWMCIPNIQGPFGKLNPSMVYVPVYPTDVVRHRFWRKNEYLFMEGTDIKVDEASLLHASGDREYRIPPELANRGRVQLLDWIRDSIHYSKSILLYNPMFAQPCYSIRLDKVCHLIPLYTEHVHDAEHLAGALFVNNGRAATIYTVEMARNHACLFTIPKACWLPD